MGRNRKISKIIVKKALSTIGFLVVLPTLLIGQSFWTGDSTIMRLSDRTVLYFEGNIKLHGDLTNTGTLVVDRDLDFFSNDSIGNIRLTSDVDQFISGDTLYLGNLTINKTGRVALKTNSMLVFGLTDLTSGTIFSDSIGKMVILGGVNELGNGYVEGAVVQRTQAGSTVVPVGINGFKNYLTLLQTNAGTFFTLACLPPNPNLLQPEAEMIGVADDHIWIMASLNDSIVTEVRTEYSGIDLTNFAINNPINSDVFQAALAYRTPTDSTFKELASNQNTYRTSTDLSQGLIESTETVTIKSQPFRIGVSLIPIQVVPVLYIPNSFAPDGQYEENRTFRPFFSGPEVTRVSVRILNSSNNEIYSFDNTGVNLDPGVSSWDGSLPSGGLAPRGIYFYSIQLEAGGQLYEQAGSVLLVRL